MTLPRTRLSAAFALALAAGVLTACAGGAAPEPGATQTTAPTPSAPAPEPSPEPVEESPGEDPTCTTIISPDVVADFESIGWSAQAEPFYLGNVELPDGLQCMWADFEGPASDHLQLFGWAPIPEADVADAQAALVSQGWVREDADGGVYITENPETTIAVDEDGYGMTYLFANGWVKLADTKQGLLLIEWPRG